MAFAVTSKAAPVAASLLNNLRRLAAPSSSLLGPASLAATRRLYSTGGAPFFDHVCYYYKPSIGDELVLHHHHLLPNHHSMFFNPAAPRWWMSKQDDDIVEVTVAMPGLPKERVKAWTNNKGLFVKVELEGVKGPDDAVVHHLVELSADEFDLDKAKAEMKHGLLKVTVPKVKGTEIKIE